jgi:hypothetical protein
LWTWPGDPGQAKFPITSHRALDRRFAIIAQNPPQFRADNWCMGDWFSKIIGRIASKKPGSHGMVQQALEAALRSRARVMLEAPDQGIVSATIIEQITREELIVDQPSIGGLTYPLAFGERLGLSFVIGRTHYTGRTRCLGRTRLSSGAGEGRGPLYAYRLMMPESLKGEERRDAPRTEIMPEIAPKAQLYVGTLGNGMFGQLTSISMTGARIHTDQSLALLSLGQEVYLKTTLPEPVGLLDELVEVQRLEPDHRTGLSIIGVQFRRRIDRLEALMRFPSDRVVQAAAAASVPQRKTA